VCGQSNGRPSDLARYGRVLEGLSVLDGCRVKPSERSVTADGLRGLCS
jgi:hypothetical protein